MSIPSNFLSSGLQVLFHSTLEVNNQMTTVKAKLIIRSPIETYLNCVSFAACSLIVWYWEIWENFKNYAKPLIGKMTSGRMGGNDDVISHPDFHFISSFTKTFPLYVDFPIIISSLLIQITPKECICHLAVWGSKTVTVAETKSIWAFKPDTLPWKMYM